MKYIDAEKLIAELTKMQFDLNAAYRKPQSDNIVRAISLEYDDILSLVDSSQQEQPMPDSTKLIELWHQDKEMLKEKDFRDDPWRLAYNAFMCGFGRGLAVKQQEQPEVDLKKFTEKIKSFQARYKHPESISIKGAMAFMARMFYQYPNVARQWYEQLPKATMD